MPSILRAQPGCPRVADELDAEAWEGMAVRVGSITPDIKGIPCTNIRPLRSNGA